MSTASRSRAATAGRPGEVRTVNGPAAALESLDEVIHQKARLGIMSTLMAVGEADFKLLKETLGLSDGNLSTHLALLDDRGQPMGTQVFRPRDIYRELKRIPPDHEMFTTRISDQLALRYSHSLCSTPTIGGKNENGLVTRCSSCGDNKPSKSRLCW